MDRDKYVNGLYFWSCVEDAKVLESMNYLPMDDDVIIVTYPKSGTTLVQNLVYLLKNKGEYPINFKLADHVPFLDLKGVECLQNLPRPKLIKTHLPFAKIVFNERAKYIFVCRNPFDCCVSYFHHTKGLKVYYDWEEGTFDEFFELFITGDKDYGDYFDHLNSWFSRKDKSNILFVTYEDMIEDIKTVIRNVGDFLGGQFQETAKDQQLLDQVVEKVSFKSMKMKEECFPRFQDGMSGAFLRKGVVGDYKNYFSRDQQQALSEKFREKCSHLPVYEKWSKYCTQSDK